MVPTVDTVRYNYLVSALVASQNPVLLVGPVGTGKTSIAQSVLQSLPSSQWSVLIVNMSAQVRCGTRGAEGLPALLSSLVFLLGDPAFLLHLLHQTTSNNVQSIIESRVEKRTKGVYVPFGGKSMIAFMDDLNMPARDTFGSQPPLELLRLWIDYGFWYDRTKQTIKYIRVSLPRSRSPGLCSLPQGFGVCSPGPRKEPRNPVFPAPTHRAPASSLPIADSRRGLCPVRPLPLRPQAHMPALLPPRVARMHRVPDSRPASPRPPSISLQPGSAPTGM